MPGARREVGTVSPGVSTAEPWRASAPRASLAAAAALVLLAACLVLDPPSDSLRSPFVVAAGAAVVIGELVPVHALTRWSAPLSSVSILALVLTPALGEGNQLASATSIVGMIGLCLLAAAGLTALAGQAGWAEQVVILGPLAARFFGGVVAAFLARGVSIGGRNLLEWTFATDSPLWALALSLVAVGAVAWGVERGVYTLIWESPDVRPTQTGRTRRLDSAIGLAVATSAPLIALSFPEVGLAALPLYLLPVAVVLVTLRRYFGVQRTRRQTLQLLARLPQVAAQGRPDHSVRVADLSLRVALEMGVSGADAEVVEQVAMLHDVGQLGLPVPLEHGMTLHASEPQVAAMAASGRRIAAVASPDAAEEVAAVHTPYRRSHELGEEIPLASRVIHVVSAYDDLTEGATSDRIIDLALERLHLGLGYEYDPEVVEILERLVRQPTTKGW
nr:HD domain-containing protein [Marihabitans asiaticum]